MLSDTYSANDDLLRTCSRIIATTIEQQLRNIAERSLLKTMLFRLSPKILRTLMPFIWAGTSAIDIFKKFIRALSRIKKAIVIRVISVAILPFGQLSY